VAICDFNNDNRLDIAISYFIMGSIGIMLRLKSEPFGTPALFSTGNDSHPNSVTIGDSNNDSQQDIAIVNSNTNNIGILLGNGNGTFIQQRSYSTGDNSQPVSIALGYINNYTHFDVAVVNSKINTIVIFRGYGNETIALLTIYSTGISSTQFGSFFVSDVH
jgi:hypothetical protein